MKDNIRLRSDIATKVQWPVLRRLLRIAVTDPRQSVTWATDFFDSITRLARDKFMNVAPLELGKEGPKIQFSLFVRFDLLRT